MRNKNQFGYAVFNVGWSSLTGILGKLDRAMTSDDDIRRREYLLQAKKLDFEIDRFNYRKEKIDNLLESIHNTLDIPRSTLAGFYEKNEERISSPFIRNCAEYLVANDKVRLLLKVLTALGMIKLASVLGWMFGLRGSAKTKTKSKSATKKTRSKSKSIRKSAKPGKAE